MSSRAGYPAQVHKTASTETPRPSQLAQASTFQLSTSVPKSFFSKQPVRSKHPTGCPSPLLVIQLVMSIRTACPHFLGKLVDKPSYRKCRGFIQKCACDSRKINQCLF